MRALIFLLVLMAAGCSTLPSSVMKYVDTDAARPQLHPMDVKPYFVVWMRDMSGKRVGGLVDGGYIQEAIYLAEHSKTKIASSAPKPRGAGYVLQFFRDGTALDWFEFWPEEVVVHGQRWAIENKRLADHERMVWFGEFPKPQTAEPISPAAAARG